MILNFVPFTKKEIYDFLGLPGWGGGRKINGMRENQCSKGKLEGTFSPSLHFLPPVPARRQPRQLD